MKKTHWFITTLILTLLMFSAVVNAQDPTQEATPEATQEMTPEATQEVTPEATQEMTPEATQEAAPEETGLKVDGSDNLAALVQTLAGTTPITVESNGPNAAFAAYCSGELSLVMSTRYITDEEELACQAAGITFIENLIGYQGLVVLLTQNLGEPPVECVSLSDLDGIYGFPADGQPGNLQQLFATAADIALTVYSPSADSQAYQLLQAILPSNQVRGDVTSYEEPSAVLDLLRDPAAPAIAYMTFAEFSQLEDTSNLTVLSIRDAATQRCDAPNLGNLEANTYAARRPLMLYAASDAVELLQAVNMNPDTATRVAEAGFTAPSEAIFGRNINNLAQPLSGRTYSRSTTPVVVNSAATGEVSISGSPLAAELVQALTQSATIDFPNITIKTELLGDAQGWTDFCAGNSPILVTTQTGECADEATSVVIGTEAVVAVVASKNDSIPACVSSEALVNAFAMPEVDPEAETPAGEDRNYTIGATNWNQLDASYPDLPLYVLLPGRSSLETDWTFAAAGAANRISRSDKEDNVSYGSLSAADTAAFRLEGVANFEGGAITLVRWSDYQNNARQADLRLLELDFGNGCALPSEETFLSGEYPLATVFSLYLSAQNIGTEANASLAWSMLSDGAVQALESLNLVDANSEGLRQTRDDVFRLIEEAAALQAEIDAQATPEATAEVTGEATSEAAADATAEAATEATSEVAPEMTAEATVEATPEATAESE